MKGIAAAILAIASVVGGFWVGGFDFDHRGELAFACYYLSGAAGVLAFNVFRD